MNKLDDEDELELDRLLARGHLSGGQYDRIERRVLARVAPKPARWLWPALLPAAALASVLGIWVVSGRDGDATRGPENPAAPGARVSDGFTPKGAAPAAGLLSIGCNATTPGSCRLGDTLMFSVHAGAPPGYLVAYAERAGDGAGARIWYFPSASGAAPRVQAQSVTTVLPEGIRLGPPHAAGRYRVWAFISETPPDRAKLVSPGGPDRAELVLEIVD